MVLEIISWSSNGTKRENDQDIMYLVSPSEEITFSVITNEPCSYIWEINKVDQGINSDNIIFTVPNTYCSLDPSKCIWEIHLKVSNANNEVHLEWVVSTLSIDEAPDIFDYFADLKWTGRTDTDPWGRALPTWSGSVGKVFNGYLESDATITGNSDIAYGTWKFRWRFPNAIDNWDAKAIAFYYLRLDGTKFYSRSEVKDAHHHCMIEYGGEGFSIDYDGGGVYENNEWHETTIVRTKDGWIYMYKDDMFDYWAQDDVPDWNREIKIHLFAGAEINFDNLEVYKDKYLFPPKKVIYADYIWNYENYYPTPLKRPGIVMLGMNITLSGINNAINNPSLFTYDSDTRTAICYTDLVIFDGAEFIMEDETLKFHCDYDGELHFASKYGSTLKIKNSTITTTNAHYFVWNNAGSTTHLGHSMFIVDPKTLYSDFGTYYSCKPGSGWAPGIPTGTIYDPVEIQYSCYARFIIENSTINNTAHMFFDSPYELNIINTQITNLHETDIGNYYEGGGGADYKTSRGFAKGDKGFWVYIDDKNIHNYVLRGLTITGTEGPINATFMLNAHRDKNNVYDINLENENIVIKKSLAQINRQSHTCYNNGWPYKPFPSYIDSKLGLVNCKFNDLIIPTEQALGVPKYYLDVKVVDENGVVPDAVVSVSNEVDANYPAENTEVMRPYATGKYSCVYHHYRFVDGQPINSTLTGLDGHTPLPLDKEHTIVIADYVKDNSGIQNFTYTITAYKDEKMASMSGLDIDESWYREEPNSIVKTIICDLDTGECYLEECPKPKSLFTHNAKSCI